MQWKAIKEAGEITIDGRDHDLQHLQDSEFTFAIPAAGGYPEINASMLVQYGSHCVSRGPRHGERFDFAELGNDRLIVDEKGKDKVRGNVLLAKKLRGEAIRRPRGR